MNRAVQGVILLLLGGAVLRISLTDMYLRYVRDGLRPFLIASGLVLLAVSAATLWPELVHRKAGQPTHRDPEQSRGQDMERSGHRNPEQGQVDPGTGYDRPAQHNHHSHREPVVSWLLLLPVLALLLVAPPALGSDAASRTGSALSTRAASDFPPLPAGDPGVLSVLDYATRAVFGGDRSLGNRRVQLSGFIMRGGDGQIYLARMIMTCCAADARPIKVALMGNLPDRLAMDSWVEVIGRYSPDITEDEINGEAIPFLEVEQIRTIPAPRNQYE